MDSNKTLLLILGIVCIFLIHQIKEPLVVTAITFLLSLPIIKTMLAKYLPKLFATNVSKTVETMGLLIKAIIAGVIFFALKNVL
jgi:hypothetical protein